ncbi:probable 28S ribosomal protein S26, mitochondrial [Odontomachus brunneus]|uniref:probable 28S ribosomal protein S26, mitochondrial n=1 Tax=Odontomachus brunneus TaxID=486640 RepID=UPI0013F1AC5B|nr:probable 28S ribosomal protein S26, mitochondrial [Odontomachus brunneus]
MQAMRMIMKSSNIYESFVPNSVYTQSIRWKRKPIWLPPSKSKMFHVPKRPVIPKEEEIELKYLYNIYRTYISSLRSHIEANAIKSNVEFSETTLEQEEDFQICKTINDKWNAHVAEIRETRLIAKREASKEKALQKMMKIEEEQEKLKKLANEEIRKFKEEAVTFITTENIDAAIEECLANVVNHNRAVDLDGNWYDGKYPAISTVEETQPVVAQQ